MSTSELRVRESDVRRPRLVFAEASWRDVVAHLALGTFVFACLALTVEATVARSRFIATSTLTPDLPVWVVGPMSRPAGSVLRALGIAGLTTSRYALLFCAMGLCYLVVVWLSDRIGLRFALGAIVVVQAAIFLGPVMQSPDVFGYISYGRIGAVHGLSPYLFGTGTFPADPVFPYLLHWKAFPSPYGPLFMLGAYALAPLPVAIELWALKLVALAASLGSVALAVACADRLSIRPQSAALFMGLNPLLLVWAVGGAHNDLLVMFLSAAAIYCVTYKRERLGSIAVVSAAAIKASAGILVPFELLGAHRRGRALTAALGSVLVVGVVILAVFGDQLIGYLHVLSVQGSFVSNESFPNVVSWLVRGAPDRLGSWALLPVIHTLAEVGFFVTLAVQLVRTWRGADWITATGWATVALLLTTTWLFPWYIVWLLPFAALSRSRPLRYTALVVTAFIFVTWLPTP